MAFYFFQKRTLINKAGYVLITYHYDAIQTAWHYFFRRELSYDDLMSPAKPNIFGRSYALKTAFSAVFVNKYLPEYSMSHLSNFMITCN